MLAYARTLIGRPFSNIGMFRSLFFPRKTDSSSFFCAELVAAVLKKGGLIDQASNEGCATPVSLHTLFKNRATATGNPYLLRQATTAQNISTSSIVQQRIYSPPPLAAPRGGAVGTSTQFDQIKDAHVRDAPLLAYGELRRRLPYVPIVFFDHTATEFVGSAVHLLAKLEVDRIGMLLAFDGCILVAALSAKALGKLGIHDGIYEMQVSRRALQCVHHGNDLLLSRAAIHNCGVELSEFGSELLADGSDQRIGAGEAGCFRDGCPH